MKDIEAQLATYRERVHLGNVTASRYVTHVSALLNRIQDLSVEPPMSLLDQAKAIAEKKRRDADEKQDQERQHRDRLQAALRVLSDAVLTEVQKLDGQPGRGGFFRVHTELHSGTICKVLMTNRHSQLFEVRAEIERGEMQHSDEARPVPYETPHVYVRDENSPGKPVVCSADGLEDLPKFFAKLAEYISQWVEA